MRDAPRVSSGWETPGGQGARRAENREAIQCFTCGKRGHIARYCRTNALVCIGLPGDMRREGTVNGQRARGIILDTGCSRTMVHRKLVSETQILEGESAVVRCAHGDSVLYPMAKVNIEVDGCTISVVAAVSDTLPMDFLLGTDVPELGKLLHGVSVEFGGEAHVLAATTRARAKLEAEAERESQRKQQPSDVRPHAVLPTEETQPEVWNVGEELDETIFTGGRERQHLSRSQSGKDGKFTIWRYVRNHQKELEA